MTYHDIHVFGIELSVSVDGGQTYTQSAEVINSTDVPPGQGITSCPPVRVSSSGSPRPPATSSATS
jgi:hypothetical protein